MDTASKTVGGSGSVEEPEEDDINCTAVGDGMHSNHHGHHGHQGHQGHAGHHPGSLGFASFSFEMDDSKSGGISEGSGEGSGEGRGEGSVDYGGAGVEGGREGGSGRGAHLAVDIGEGENDATGSALIAMRRSGAAGEESRGEGVPSQVAELTPGPGGVQPIIQQVYGPDSGRGQWGQGVVGGDQRDEGDASALVERPVHVRSGSGTLII